MNTSDLRLTNIRLLTTHDVGDALQIGETFLCFSPSAKHSEHYEYSKSLFAALSLQLIYSGYAELKDVLVFADRLMRMPGLHMPDHFTILQKTTAVTSHWLNRFSNKAHDPQVIFQCLTHWVTSIKRYEQECEQEPQADDTDHKHPAFNKILQLATARKNVLLVGPAGTGKTHAARQVAARLGLDFASVSVTAGMSVSQLTGWLMPTGYLESDFVRLYENGGVFLLDEMDAADANTLTVINQAIANGSFNIAQRTGNSQIQKHRDFVCIAAANTFGTGGDMIYAGREQLDAATLDRFMTVFIDYDRHFEFKRCDPEVLAFTGAVRSAISQLKLRRVMSTRKAIDFSDMMRGPSRWTLADCKECYFTGWSADEKAKISTHI